MVCLVKAGINPCVHLFPQSSYLRVTVFPFYEHVVGFLDKRSFCLGFLLCTVGVHAIGYVFVCQFFNLCTIVGIKFHIIVSYKVVAFLAT